MKKTKRIVIIGAGPGGLAAALLLAHRGHEVHVYEKEAQVGGRNGALHLDGYTFDIGPTFFMMPFVLEEIFAETGRDLHEYIDLREIDPLYRLCFPGRPDFYPTRDRSAMLRHIEEIFPGDSSNYERFMTDEKRKFNRIFPCLKRTYLHWWDLINQQTLAAIPSLDLGHSVYDVLSRYFNHDDLRISMTFQAKYLGMSPWDCPGFFAILPFIEHEWGIHHPIGGLNQLSVALAKAAQECGATIHLDTPVDKVIVKDGTAVGVRVQDQAITADITVINADFGYAMTELIDEKNRRRWTDSAVKKRRYSCSTFMLYLGLDTQYDLAHHNVFFAQDYRENVTDIVQRKQLSDDFSFYLQHPWQTDSTLAPDGHSTLYVLIPTPNLTADINWEEAKSKYADRVLDAIETRAGLTDIRQHIVTKQIIAPLEWQTDYNVYEGAVFNMGHQLKQMLHRRPKNRLDDIKNCYLVGGGTHPGSGLPTILESGKIAANLISKK